MDYIKWFDQISMEDIARVEGKTTSLEKMYRELSSQMIQSSNANFAGQQEDYLNSNNENNSSVLKEVESKLEKNTT